LVLLVSSASLFLAAPCAVPQRAVEGMSQVEEPGERGGAA